MKLLLADLEGTIRRPKSSSIFIQDPYDQQIIPEAAMGLKIHAHQGWRIIGITNQGGVKSGYKSFQDCILEQRATMNLAPWLEEIIFCPDAGDSAYGLRRINDDLREYHLYHRHLRGSFRKPGTGMLKICKCLFPKQIAYIGDRPEDALAAANADIEFIHADIWHERFRGVLSDFEFFVNSPADSFLDYLPPLNAVR